MELIVSSHEYTKRSSLNAQEELCMNNVFLVASYMNLTAVN